MSWQYPWQYPCGAGFFTEACHGTEMKSIGGQATTAAMDFSRWLPGSACMPHCNAKNAK
jgi:hypothetical protein